jgi:hypothetical protein
MVVRVAVVCVLVAGCGDNGPARPDAGVPREQVALVPIAPRDALDLLFVIDDSASVLHLHDSLRRALPALLGELGRARALPSLHVGVVTSDLGTLGADDTAPGPGIGSGPGSCSGTGKDAALQPSSSMLVAGTFVSDLAAPDGTRTTNYSGALSDAIASLTYVGSSGCGFEQPLEAARRALDSHPANAGFLRPTATLAVVLLQDEDDCSFVHSSLLAADPTVLGPLQSFRCTRFGVACDDGGVTTDDMAALGPKSGCHWRDDSAYLTSRSRYETFFASIKPDRRDVLVAAIAGPPAPFVVDARTPPGGGTAIPALAHVCQWSSTSGVAVADPAVRVHDLVHRAARGRFEPVCDLDQTPAALAIARELRGLLGDACLTRDIALPADCEVFDQSLAGEQPLPPCSSTTTTDCHQLVEDAACTTSHRLRVDVTRSAPPSADTMVAVRCHIGS